MMVGIDEVGRGCWAGPLVAGAVIIQKPITGLRDSKKLSKPKRELLDELIRDQAADYGLGWVWPAEIDEYGLSWAVKTAMRRAINEINLEYDQIIIDGNINYFPDDVRATAVIKADDSVPAVSAASIIAKVARDSYMSELPDQYQMYGFERHVGYGTAAHVAALKKFGISDIHRRSYKPIARLSSS